MHSSLLFRRRSPKSLTNENAHTDPGKLSSEAFRLLRTAQSLINLRAPVLIESSSSSSSQSPRNSTDYRPTTSRLPSSARCTTPPPSATASTFNGGSIQRQALNRDSRMSMQSSTDDSVHSNSSSHHDTEEDEDCTTTSHHTLLFAARRPSIASSSTTATLKSLDLRPFKTTVATATSSSADEESGFSSMSSFQEIGLPATPSPPLHTIAARTLPARSRLSITSNGSSNTCNPQSHCELAETYHRQQDDDTITDDSTTVKLRHPASSAGTNRDSTLLPICHRRWSSAPPIPPKRTLSTFVTGGHDEPLQVLWV